VVALVAVGPERHHGFQRRAAGYLTGQLRHQDRRIFRQRKALARPILDLVERRDEFGTALLRPIHAERLGHAAAPSRGAASLEPTLHGALIVVHETRFLVATPGQRSIYKKASLIQAWNNRAFVTT